MTVSYKLLGVPYALAQSAVAVSHTGNTTETTLATITIPAGAMGPNGRVTIITDWITTNNANTKTVKIKFAGTSYLNYTGLTSAGSGRFITIVRNVNSAASQKSLNSSYLTFITSSSTANITSSADTSASDTTILITGQLAVGSDTMTLDGYSVEVVYGA